MGRVVGGQWNPFESPSEDEGYEDEDGWGRSESESDFERNSSDFERNSDGEFRDKSEFVCFSAALTEYNVKKADLADLECKRVRNPRYRNAAPMRLYLRTDVEAASKAKEERLAYEAKNAHKIKAKKDAERAAKKAAKAYKARKSISGWKRPVQTLVDSGTPLPVDIWVRVLQALRADLEPEGVRGVSVVARDLFNAGMTCKELHGCALQAFIHLSSLCPPVKNCKSGLEQEWNAFLKDPTSFKLPQLKTLATTVGVPKSLQKPALIMQLLQKVGVDSPPHVPFRVVWTIATEKARQCNQLACLCASIPGLLQPGNVFALRKRCMDRGLCTTQLLRAENEKVREAQQRAIRERQRLLQEREQSRLQHKRQQKQQRKQAKRQRRQQEQAHVPGRNL